MQFLVAGGVDQRGVLDGIGECPVDQRRDRAAIEAGVAALPAPTSNGPGQYPANRVSSFVLRDDAENPPLYLGAAAPLGNGAYGDRPTTNSPLIPQVMDYSEPGDQK